MVSWLSFFFSVKTQSRILKRRKEEGRKDGRRKRRGWAK